MRAKGQEGCQTAGCVIDLIKSKSKPKTRTVCWLKGAGEKEECASEVVKGVRERERERRGEEERVLVRGGGSACELWLHTLMKRKFAALFVFLTRGMRSASKYA